MRSFIAQPIIEQHVGVWCRTDNAVLNYNTKPQDQKILGFLLKWEIMKNRILDKTSKWYRETELSKEQRVLLVRKKLERIHEYHRQNQHWLEKIANKHLR